MKDRKERRKREGQEAERRAARPSLNRVLELPLMQALADAGGSAAPSEVYAAVAGKMGLDGDVRSERRSHGGRTYSAFDHTCRWVRQTLVMKGLIGGSTRGRWELLDAGFAKLGRIAQGKVVLLYRVDDGLALWGRCEDVAGHISPSSLSLIMVSPPYPQIDREYGKMTVEEWLRWMSHLVGSWKSLLTPDGTLAVNIGDVFVGGSPTLSLYPERFLLDAVDRHGYSLAGRMPWHSPNKLGSMAWALRRRAVLRNTVEHVIMLSRSPNPAWDADRVDREVYVGPERVGRKGSARRPTGHDLRDEAFTRKAGGRIPSNLIVAGGGSAGVYGTRCRAAGLPIHPARFPEAVPRRAIQIATAPGDTVWDPMAGAGTTAKVASELGRRFIISEPVLPYVYGSSFRFDGRDDFVMERPDLDPRSVASAR